MENIEKGEEKMSILFIEYPKCTTCKKAKKWLDDHGIAYEDRHIKEQNPTAEELTIWYQKSGLPIKRFVNTSGMLYREMNLKDKLPAMTDEEILELLATDGMLVKRPLIIAKRYRVNWGRSKMQLYSVPNYIYRKILKILNYTWYWYPPLSFTP